MRETYSNTKLARQGAIEFWKDGLPHTAQQFMDYVYQTGETRIKSTHINSAVRTAMLEGYLERISRGVYIKSKKDCREKTGYGAEGSQLKRMIKQVTAVLSMPINAVDIDEKEREILPKLQDFYRLCKEWLEESEKEEQEYGVSRQEDSGTCSEGISSGVPGGTGTDE